MPYVEKLKTIKEVKGLSTAKIAEDGDIPLATVIRVFNGQTLNPTFETIVGIAKGVGISLDELAGLKQPDAPPVPSALENSPNPYSELLKEKDYRIQELKIDKLQLIADKETIRSKNNKLLLVLICSTTTLLVLLGVLITIVTMTH